jgi:hypothetical protein
MVKDCVFPTIALMTSDIDCHDYRCLAAFNAIMLDCDVDNNWYSPCDLMAAIGTACPAGGPSFVHANLLTPLLVFWL